MFNFWVVVLAHSFPLPLSAPLSTPYPSPIFFLSASSPHTSPSSLLPTLNILQASCKHLARCKTQPSLFHPSHWTDYLSNLMPKQGGFNEIEYLRMQVRIQQTPSPPTHIHFLTSPSPSPFSLISAFSFFILYDTPFPAILIFFLLDKICLLDKISTSQIFWERQRSRRDR